MSHKRITMILMMGLLALIYINCAHVNYVGKTMDPTFQIDVFYSESEISLDYMIIGHAIGAGQMFVSENKIQEKLIEKAREKGADGIIITEMDRDSEVDGRGFDSEKQVKASFLKYK